MRGKKTTLFKVASIAAAAALFAASESLAFDRHDLDVEIDLAGRAMRGVDVVTTRAGGGPLELTLRKDSALDSASVDGVEVEYLTEYDAKRKLNLIKMALPADAGGKKLKLAFHGAFEGLEAARGGITRGVARVADGFIDADGAFLSSSSPWYPREDGELASFELRASVPDGNRAVSSGDLTASRQNDGRVVDAWSCKNHVDGIDLVVGKYRVTEKAHGKIKLYAYLLGDDPELARLYLDKSAKHIDAYASMIAPYPYGKFAVVEGPLPTGYGMPSFTLLGSAVIRLPFIPDTSLAHEIAHNWWGNSVFVSSDGGNWSEALATYTADYLQAVARGEDLYFRESKLRAYRNFAGAAPAPLKDLYDSATQAGRAVAYDKGAMVLNMLRSEVGRQAFDAGLRLFYAKNAFKKASWNDLMASFEKASGRKLDWFLDQWIWRSGAPKIWLDDAMVERVENGFKIGYRLTIWLRQSEPAYKLKLPVVIATERGDVVEEVVLSKRAEEFTIDLKAAPTHVTVDPKSETMRLLHDEEVFPVFSAVLGDPKAVVVVPRAEPARTKYLAAAELIKRDYGLRIVSEDDLSARAATFYNSTIILGGKGENLSYLPFTNAFNASVASVADRPGGTSRFSVAVVALQNSFTPSKTTIILIADTGAAEDGARRLRHSTDETILLIKEDGVVEKRRAEGKKPLARKVRQ